MNRMIVALMLSTLMLSGCKKNMEYKPQDFFEGAQLEIAQLIFDGNEPSLKQKIAIAGKEELNRPAKAKMTLLFWSVLSASYDNTTPERLQIITDLVRAGADPLQPKGKGESSPAEFVLKGDKGDWIKAMLDGGLSPNARDKTFDEPIIFESLKAKNINTLNTLFKYGADLNTKDSLGRNLLIYALYAAKIKHIEFLLENGADPLLVDSYGENFKSELNKMINRHDKNNEYIKSLINIRDKFIN